MAMKTQTVLPSHRSRPRWVDPAARQSLKGQLRAKADPRRFDALRPPSGNGQASRRRRPGSVLVGTASWTDPGFVKDWYPKKLPVGERLSWYAEHFNLVEVNSSFYAVPSQHVVAGWVDKTPAGFVFDVKLHRLLSRHSTQLALLPPDLRRIAQEHRGRVQLTRGLETALTRRFLESVAPLADAGKLGALLLQPSPSFGPRKHSLDELDHVLELLADFKVAVELRNRNWVVGEQLDRTVAYFKKRGIAFVTVDAPDRDHFMVMPSIDLVTTPKFAYLRAHGRNAEGYVRGRSVAERFDYDYSDAELKEIAARVAKLAKVAKETHVIFNNNKSSYAPKAGQRFHEIVAAQSPQMARAASATA